MNFFSFCMFNGMPGGYAFPAGGLQPMGNFHMAPLGGNMPIGNMQVAFPGGNMAMGNMPMGACGAGGPNSPFLFAPGAVPNMAGGGQLAPAAQGGQPAPPMQGGPQPPQGDGGTANIAVMDGGQSMVVPPIPNWPDDSKKLANSYKMLGIIHKVGARRCTPLKFRASLTAACNSTMFPMMKVVSLGDEHVDFLVYILAGVLPNVKPCDFGCTTKGEVRAAIRSQFLSKMRRNPRRLDVLSEDLDNLGAAAMKLGYPAEHSSPPMASACARCKSPFSMMQATFGGGSTTLAIEGNSPVRPQGQIPMVADQGERVVDDDGSHSNEALVGATELPTGGETALLTTLALPSLRFSSKLGARSTATRARTAVSLGDNFSSASSISAIALLAVTAAVALGDGDESAAP